MRGRCLPLRLHVAHDASRSSTWPSAPSSSSTPKASLLRGLPDSVARCVNILGGYWPLIRNVLMLSLVTLVGSAISIAWMKLVAVPLHPGPAVWCTALVALICAVAACKMAQLSRELSIGREDLVEGDLTISTASGAQIDIMAERSANIPIATR